MWMCIVVFEFVDMICGQSITHTSHSYHMHRTLVHPLFVTVWCSNVCSCCREHESGVSWNSVHGRKQCMYAIVLLDIHLSYKRSIVSFFIPSNISYIFSWFSAFSLSTDSSNKSKSSIHSVNYVKRISKILTAWWSRIVWMWYYVFDILSTDYYATYSILTVYNIQTMCGDSSL